MWVKWLKICHRSTRTSFQSRQDKWLKTFKKVQQITYKSWKFIKLKIKVFGYNVSIARLPSINWLNWVFIEFQKYTQHERAWSAFIFIKKNWSTRKNLVSPFFTLSIDELKMKLNFQNSSINSFEPSTSKSFINQLLRLKTFISSFHYFSCWQNLTPLFFFNKSSTKVTQ